MARRNRPRSRPQPDTKSPEHARKMVLKYEAMVAEAQTECEKESYRQHADHWRRVEKGSI